MTKPVLSRLFILFAALGSADLAHSQSSGSVWEGIYSTEQATLGAMQFNRECASCHGEDLRGDNTAPSLRGMSFMFLWEGRSIGELFTKIETQMPTGRPNSLPRPTYLNILAYILSVNEFPAGANDLKADLDKLAEILIKPSAE